jgi:hypothetical protein
LISSITAINLDLEIFGGRTLILNRSEVASLKQIDKLLIASALNK